jgi:hypothetical protein
MVDRTSSSVRAGRRVARVIDSSRALHSCNREHLHTVLAIFKECARVMDSSWALHSCNREYTYSGGIYKQSMGARNRVGIGLSYRLHINHGSGEAGDKRGQDRTGQDRKMGWTIQYLKPGAPAN